MVKVCLEQFPEGSYKGQKGDGYGMDGYLQDNVDVLANNIHRDMQFVGLISGDGTVRNGKSAIGQQVGFYYSSQVSKKHNIEVPFTTNNIVFKADDLIARAFELPKYSCIILDEGDDLTEHHFSKLSKKLKKFFRKCGQLNLFIILILPDFFELPMGYAITRSNFLINVKFAGEFERGFFDYFGPKNKKYLYLKCKRYKDYQGQSSDFSGRFVNLYTVDEDAYRKMKFEDMTDDGEEEVSTAGEILKVKRKIVWNLYQQFPITSKAQLVDVFEMSAKSIQNYYNQYCEIFKNEKTKIT